MRTTSDIEVFKHGKYYQTIECKECGAGFGFTPRSIQSFVTVDPGNDGKNYKYEKHFLVCPECGNIITLKLDVSPIEVEETEKEDKQEEETETE